MRGLRFSLLILAGFWSSAASAAVEIHFYSKDFASTFPHAFVRLTGTIDATGEKVDTNFGFTPVRLNPSILMGPVKGMIQTVDSKYVARSDKHFTLQLTDDQYRMVLTRIESWRTSAQPNYRLESRNCVYFVADVASALGLQAPPAPGLMKKPKTYLRKVAQDNLALIANWPNPTGTGTAAAATASAAAH